jgi:hypothetical protein
MSAAPARALRPGAETFLACPGLPVVVDCVAYTVSASLDLDTFGGSSPYMTGWSKGNEIERYAELIDRLARRIEKELLEVEPPREDGEGQGLSRL